MSLNHLNGWQRLGLVLTAIYWVGVVIAGVQSGFVVGSYAPPTPAEQAAYAEATAPLAERLAAAQKTGEAAAARTLPESDYEAELRRAGDRMNAPLGEAIRQQQPPAAPSIDANGMPLGVPKSAAQLAAENTAPVADTPARFAWPPFWLALGMGAGGYVAIAGLVWAGLGFRKARAAGVTDGAV